MTDTTRAGFVALIGEPNAGKSTLLNRMVGAKVSIVTHKVQTTRARIRGVAMEGATQIVFVDTPGLFRPRRRLDRAMVQNAWDGAADADVREGQARKLQYQGKFCVLDAYLYPKDGGEPRVSYIDAREPDGSAIDRASCVAALTRRDGGR